MPAEKEPRQEIDFRQRPLVIVDLETTRLDEEKHEIIEIGCVVVDFRTLEVIKEYSVKVQPKHIETADPNALETNGYSPQAWQEAISLKQALEEFNQLAPGGMLSGWNVGGFDWKFLTKAFRREGITFNFDYHLHDVLGSAAESLRTSESPKHLSLRTVSEFLGIPHEQAHQALADARATLAVLKN